ncbi:glycosyltransferase, partial [bacterium]|nr:glycosyltransferase [bacterium]
MTETDAANPSRETKPTLTIVIPALNEEEAIATTIQNCIDAQPAIVSQTCCGDVEIILVSDGSTDRTV